jgi:hypothetical protein
MKLWNGNDILKNRGRNKNKKAGASVSITSKSDQNKKYDNNKSNQHPDCVLNGDDASSQNLSAKKNKKNLQPKIVKNLSGLDALENLLTEKVVLCVPALLALLVYSNSIYAGFVYDDQ